MPSGVEHNEDGLQMLRAIGAWGDLDAQGHPWTLAIEWLYRFAASLPMPADCDIEVLKHRRMAVRAALRVELALRSGDIPRAVHGTVAFFEAALWDHLGEKVSPHPDKRQFKFHAPPQGELIRERDAAKLAAFSKNKQGEDRCRPFIFKESADEVDCYGIDDSKICAIQIAKHYLNLAGLTHLGQKLGSTIRDLRNDIAHNEPTPDLMNDARNRMQTAALWSDTDTFLSQPLVQAVLKELGEASPENLLSNLLADVRRRLLAIIS